MATRRTQTVVAIPCGGPGRRELRARVEETRGARSLDLRVWLRRRSGYTPSTHGLRLDASDLPVLQDAVVALQQAMQGGSVLEAA
jgi:hypothetical protein